MATEPISLAASHTADYSFHMEETRSVIVVGAGLSGLTAAALLARRGLAVTVIEGGDRPGGSCSAFRRNGVTYDLGAAMLFGFGERGFNPHRWLMTEIDEPIEMYRHEALYRLRYGDKGVIFWPDMDRFLDELCALFPNSRDELRRFYAEITRLYDNVIAKVPVFEAPTELPAEESRRRFMADPMSQLRAISLMFRSAESLMRPYVRNAEVRQFFNKLTSTYCYTTMKETPAILVATMFVDNHVGGSYYPASSPMALVARMEKAIEKNGGVMRYRDRVVGLEPPTTSGGGAPGVRLASGELLEADVVVFAGAVKELAADLDTAGILPQRWKSKILGMEDSWPSFVVHGTVERSALPESAMPLEMFIDNTESIDESDVTLYLSGLEDPSLAPSDLCTFFLIGPSLKTWPRPSDPGYQSAAYREAKRLEADRMFGLIENRIPGFTAAVRTRIEGSPTTIERYLQKPRGSVAGPKQRMGQHLLLRPRARTPLAGLYLAGEGTVMGTGTPAVTVSGISAANAVLRDLGLPDYQSGIAEPSAVRIIPRGQPGNLPSTALGVAASACQWCEHAPCRSACPAGFDIPGVMRRVEAGNWRGARDAIARTADAAGPVADLGECCRACVAREGQGAEDSRPPCEAVCTRRSFAEEPVAILKILLELAAED
ncbi:MAG: FAD-dependent oxidoreductase [Coriobacteriia bacterium]|nr:FAD-dependent oxidoreductase [Coriobacteriia bacterium]